MRKVDLAFQTDLSPEACLIKLAEAIDPEERTFFSLSRYRGTKPILGAIAGNQFRLFKRRIWRNDVAPVLYGIVVSHERGSEIEAYWDIRGWVRTSQRLVLVMTMALSAPLFLSALNKLFAGKATVQSDFLAALLAPPLFILLLLLIFRTGQALSEREKPFVIAFLEKTLLPSNAANSLPERTWKSNIA